MSSMKNIIQHFLDWCDKLGRESRSYFRNPKNQHSHYTASPNARRKAVKLVDEQLFGIGKKK